MKKDSKLVNGLIWSFTDLLSRQGLQLFTQLLLARILLPEHFGLIGMITIFIAVSTTLVNSGMDQALIREKNIDENDYSTVFTFNLSLSVLLYLIIYFSAPAIANFFNEYTLISILRVLMIIVIFNSISLVQRVYLIRNLNFRRQTIISLISNFLAGGISIILALNGAGVWSLVAQQVIMKFFEMLFLIMFNKQGFSLSFNIEKFKKYFVFGYRLTLAGLITTSFNNILFVIIGKIYNLSILGYYANANKLRDATVQSITSAIQKVTYPILSKQQDDEQRLTSNYIKLIRMSAFLIFPVVLGIAAISPSLITLLLGEKWTPSIIYFQLLCISGMLYPIHAINLNILKVKNKSRLFLKIEIIKKSFLALFIVIAIYINAGVMLLLYAVILGSFVALFINMHFASKVITYSVKKQIKDISKPFLVSLIMFLITVIFDSIVETTYLITITSQVLIGIVTYVTFSFILRVHELKASFKILKGILIRID